MKAFFTVLFLLISVSTAFAIEFNEKSMEIFLDMLSSEYKDRAEEFQKAGLQNDAEKFFEKSFAAKRRDAVHYNENTFPLPPKLKMEAELAGVFFDRLRSNVQIFDLFPESLARMQSYYDCMLVEMRENNKSGNPRAFCIGQFDKMQKAFQRKGYTKNMIYQIEKTRESIVVYFDLNSDVLKPEYIELIQKKIGSINQDDKYKIFITGLADKTGNAEINSKISKQRAEAVKKQIIKFGININSISLDYLGDNYSLVNTQKAEKFNRRVVVDIVSYE